MVPDSAAVAELEDTALEGLTSAQQIFVRLVHSGLTNTQAYRQAYNPVGRSDGALSVAAHVVANDPKVQLKLRELRAKAEAQSTLAPMINKQVIVNGIHELATTATKESVRLAAYIALGKTRAINLFGSDPEPPAKERSPEDIDRQLLDLIRGMRATIEGNAVDVTPKDTPPKPSPSVASRKRKPRA